MEGTTMKVCYYCYVEHEGKFKICRECSYVRKVRTVNYDSSELQRKWHKDNHEKMLGYHRKYYKANRERICELNKQYRVRNREVINLRRRESRLRKKAGVYGNAGG
jgi:hypothetical protein